MTKTLKIDSEIVIDLQRLAVAVESRRDLIAFMISTDMDLTSPKFKEYEEAYESYYFQYSTLKKELENNIIAPAFGKENLIKWNLDFNTEIVTVELKE